MTKTAQTHIFSAIFALLLTITMTAGAIMMDVPIAQINPHQSSDPNPQNPQNTTKLSDQTPIEMTTGVYIIGIVAIVGAVWAASAKFTKIEMRLEHVEDRIKHLGGDR